MATKKNTTNYQGSSYTPYKSYTTPTYTPYKSYTPYKTYTPMTDPNSATPKTTKVTKVAGGTKAVNQGLGYLNQLDRNLGGLYGNSAAILIDNGAVQAYENARKNMIESTNRQYDDNANTYYQNYKQNQVKLPENLSRLGVTGGASETAALGLLNNYTGNLYQNESARANTLNEGNMRYDEMVAQNSADIAKTLADLYYNIGSGYLAEQRANQRADFEYARDLNRSDYEWNRNLNRADYEYNRDLNRNDYEWKRTTGRSDYEYNRDVQRDEFLRNEEYRREDYVRNQEYDREDASNAYDRALAQAQYTGNFSVMKQFGWSQSDVNKANRLFANGNSGGSGGSSGRSGSSGRRYYSHSSGRSGGSSGSNIDMSGYGSDEEPEKRSTNRTSTKPVVNYSGTVYGYTDTGTSGKNNNSNKNESTYRNIYARIQASSSPTDINNVINILSNNKGGLTSSQYNELYQLAMSRRRSFGGNQTTTTTTYDLRSNAGGGPNKQMTK